MLLGVLGPIATDIEAVLTMILESTDIQVVDTNDLLRNLPHKLVNKILTNNQYKKALLKTINETLGNAIVTGNAVLNTEICKWIYGTGNKLCFMVRNDISELSNSELGVSDDEYWENPQVLEYEFKTKYLNIRGTLPKQTENVYMIDIMDDDSQDLIRLAETEFEGSVEHTLTINQIIGLLGDENMTVEENIKKAMLELGIDITDNGGEIEVKPKEEKPAEEVKPAKKKPKAVAPKPKEKVALTKQEFEQLELPILSDKVEEPKPEVIEKSEPIVTEPEETEVPDSIFIKLSEDSMAILIPEGIEFEDKELTGSKFKVATVKLPNWANKRLQELLVIKETKEPKSIVKAEPVKPIEKTPEPKKPEPPKVEEKPEEPKVEKTEPIVMSEELETLITQKADIDLQIKHARELNDEQLINDLRKKRRALRKKINSLK